MSKEHLESVFTPVVIKTALWTSSCPLALPVIPQDFSLPAVLAPVVYMLRWRKRRGKGNFSEEYGSPNARLTKDRAARALGVAQKLLDQKAGSICGTSNPLDAVILADLLLAFCFENKGRSPERDAPLQRVFPTHYFSSWVDLPERISNLRGIPELVSATLNRSRFCTSGSTSNVTNQLLLNPLLGVLSDGLEVEGADPTNRQADRFNENTLIGIDQLLMVRVSQPLGVAPNPQKDGYKGEVKILADVAHQHFFEDLNIFLRCYGRCVPRATLIPMIECALAVGLTSIFTSTISILSQWEIDGRIPEQQQVPIWPLFLDCSAGRDQQLRWFAEESFSSLTRQLQRLAVQFMKLKILAVEARVAKVEGFGTQDDPQKEPGESVAILGDILHGRHKVSDKISNSLEAKCVHLADALRDDDDGSIALLEDSQLHPAHRLAEYIVAAMGPKLQLQHLSRYLDSCLMTNEPSGLAVRRLTQRQRKSLEQRSAVLSNVSLDYLVHRHLRKGKKGAPVQSLSVNQFIQVLRKRYGFFISEAPQGMEIPQEALHRNRGFLERQLRDLGLFTGVNDSERMKRLQPRFCEAGAVTEPTEE